jgi:hypothetical protein
MFVVLSFARGAKTFCSLLLAGAKTAKCRHIGLDYTDLCN